MLASHTLMSGCYGSFLSASLPSSKLSMKRSAVSAFSSVSKLKYFTFHSLFCYILFIVHHLFSVYSV